MKTRAPPHWRRGRPSPRPGGQSIGEPTGVDRQPTLRAQPQRQQVGVAVGTRDPRRLRGRGRCGREVAGAEVLVHAQEGDEAVLYAVVVQFFENAFAAAGPAGRECRLPTGGEDHRQVEAASDRAGEIAALQPHLEGALEEVDGGLLPADAGTPTPRRSTGRRRPCRRARRRTRCRARRPSRRSRSPREPGADRRPRPSRVPPSRTILAWTGRRGRAQAAWRWRCSAPRRVRSTIRSATYPASRPAPVNEHRRERVLEGQPAEVEPGDVVHDPAVLAGPAVLAEDRQVDPLERLPEAGRPDHRGGVDGGAVGKQRHAVPDTDDAGLVADDAPVGEVRALDPEHRPAVEADVGHLLAAHRRTPGDDVAPQEQQDREHDLHPPGLEPHGDLAAVPADQRGGTGLGHLVGDVRARVRGAHDEDRAVPELTRSSVLARVQLQDRRIEVGGEARAPTASARRCRWRPRRCRR